LEGKYIRYPSSREDNRLVDKRRCQKYGRDSRVGKFGIRLGNLGCNDVVVVAVVGEEE
jgi:hypothetical protein